MTVLNRLASQLGRNDEEPNVLLARQLAGESNHDGIAEIIVNLTNKNKKIQHDCIKVAYEAGELNPALISEYAETFIELLKSRDNRIVWGAMTALSAIADMSADTIMKHLEQVIAAMHNGSVITVDRGVLALSKLAAVSRENNNEIFPYLLDHLRNCRSKEVPQHAESTLLAVTSGNIEGFLRVLRGREEQLTESQLKRVKKIYRRLES
ncbi:hypothetical protein [Paenibacillus glycanilyticus]|uniref:HEAT repeat domain-containing protein n=1 Tax=Paenibacillus glycanilyticus TaxID=126569 RepID=A0ABQ6GEY5_9BACL|nr:hypothetical protein [Paenibacillus glycanilyticus]GLX69222.1 hypothetical protein MU1_35670 [Paenibacillus glycanilyticus]